MVRMRFRASGVVVEVTEEQAETMRGGTWEQVEVQPYEPKRQPKPSPTKES